MITDNEARRIASEWHSGGGSALYALASTGAIRCTTHYGWSPVDEEIRDCIDEVSPPEDEGPTDETNLQDLANLRDYIDAHGERGELPGWGSLPF